MLTNVLESKRYIRALMKVLPILSFTLPFVMLYCFQNLAYPRYENTFEMTWKGRTFYIFFIWLASLEIIINWERLQTTKVEKLRSIRTWMFIFSLLLPTLYVVASNFFGLNVIILDWAKTSGIAQGIWMPLSIEYLVLAILFVVICLAEFGLNSLANLALSPIFLATIGLVYTIDNVYEYGSFLPFQILVPATATLAANMLNFLGYQTQWVGQQLGTPVLSVHNEKGLAAFGIAWPCSGIESLIIYSVTILLFLKGTLIPWKQKIAYFVGGAVVTFFINVLRIVTIFVIAVNADQIQVQRFHDYYGQLYSIVWIISYPMIIMGSRLLYSKITGLRTGRKEIMLSKSNSPL